MITLFARGTGDENVCADDLEDFKGVATIHDESGRTCIARIEALLSGEDGGGTALAELVKRESLDGRGWTVIAENTPVDLRQVSKLLNRFRGRKIRICLAGGVETGALEYCFSTEIRLAGGRSISDGIVRIEVSDDGDTK